MIPKRGAEDIQTREETTTLTVYKVWSDSWEEHDPITVTLMRKNADGSISSTGRTVTLGADNGWTAAFDGLEIPAEGEEFAYSVVESDCEGYIAQYGEIKPASAQSGPYWVPAAGNAMQSGGSYVFGTVYNNRCYVMNKGSGNTLAAATVTQNPSVVINGVTYSDYLTDVPSTAVFTATASGSGFILRNDSSSQYLNGNSFTAQQSSATPFTLSNRLLSCSRGVYLPQLSLLKRELQPRKSEFGVAVHALRACLSECGVGIRDNDKEHARISAAGDNRPRSAAAQNDRLPRRRRRESRYRSFGR